jgi:hypothetical protein
MEGIFNEETIVSIICIVKYLKMLSWEKMYDECLNLPIYVGCF